MRRHPTIPKYIFRNYTSMFLQQSFGYFPIPTIEKFHIIVGERILTKMAFDVAYISKIILYNL